MSECVRTLVSVEDISVGDEIEVIGVGACWDAGIGEDRDEIKIGTLVLECVDESCGEIWDW